MTKEELLQDVHDYGNAELHTLECLRVLHKDLVQDHERLVKAYEALLNYQENHD